MRRFITDIFLLLIAIALAYFFRDPLLHAWNQITARAFPCSQPIAYSIGSFDARFGISKETFIKDVQKAESIWESGGAGSGSAGKPIGKQLFVYQSNGALKINLIYDDRQIATQKLEKLGIVIHDDQSTYNALKTKYDAQTKQIAQMKAALAVSDAAYQSRLDAYNKEVTYLNQHDRATQETIDRLHAEKTALEQLLVQLHDSENAINTHVDELNALVGVINRLAKSLNLTAINYNNIGASQGSEFEEGEYVSDPAGNRINIYQFDDQSKLVRVLTHEMGHALGLDHLENPKAIMYRLNNGVNEALTADDIAALKKQCGIK